MADIEKGSAEKKNLRENQDIYRELRIPAREQLITARAESMMTRNSIRGKCSCRKKSVEETELNTRI